MAGLGGTTEQLASIWRSIGLNQKLSILLVGVGSAVALLTLGFWGGRPSYAPLCTRLAAKDTAAVLGELDGLGVAYRLQDGGSTVLVPAGEMGRCQGVLHRKGLGVGQRPGGSGYELFDEGLPIGASSFIQQTTRLRALQGELERSIGEMRPIEWARVHITKPEPSVFVGQDRAARAAVLVSLRPGAVLGRSQVNTIVAFVAGGVDGLETKNVTVTDQNSTLYTRYPDGEGPASPTAHLEAQQQVEQHLTSKVSEMLTRFYGPTGHSVEVAAEVDIRDEEVESRKPDIEGRAPRKEETKTSETTDGSAAPGGRVGVTANTGPGAGRGTAAEAGKSSKDTTETTEFEVGYTRTTTVDKSVTIRRLSVAVSVDGLYEEQAGADGKTTRTFKPREAAELDKIKSLVEKAVGYDSERGDDVEVTCVQFHKSEPLVSPEAAASRRRWDLMLTVAKHLSTAVVVLAFLLVVRSMRRRAAAAAERAAEAARQAAEAARQTESQQARAAPGQPTPSPQARPPLFEQTRATMEGDPAAAADLLKRLYKGATAPVSSET